MQKTETKSIALLLKKYWYLVLLTIVALCFLGYVLYHSGKDPAELLRDYGYLVILVWTFLEGETIVIIAGWLSNSLGLTPWLIALCAFLGSFISDQVMFSLGKYKGEAVLQYFPKVASNVDKAAGLFKKYDTALILGFRFVYGVRNVTPILLGISGVSHKKFFFLNFIGAAVWSLTFTYGGLYVGKAFMKIMDHVGHGIFYGILGILAIAGVIWYLRARSTVKKAKEIANVESAAVSILGQLLLMCYFAMGVIQLTATYGLFYDYWDWPFIFASTCSIILSFIPFIGSICGLAGAILYWEWQWPGALLLFFWWPALYALAVGRFGQKNWFSKEFLKR